MQQSAFRSVSCQRMKMKEAVRMRRQYPACCCSLGQQLDRQAGQEAHTFRIAISRPNSSFDCAALAASLDAWLVKIFTATVCRPSVALYTCRQEQQ